MDDGTPRNARYAIYAILPYISGTGVLSQAPSTNCKKDKVRQNLLRVLGKDTHHARRTPYQREFNALAK